MDTMEIAGTPEAPQTAEAVQAPALPIIASNTVNVGNLAVPRSKHAGRAHGHNTRLIVFSDAQHNWLYDCKIRKMPETLIKQEMMAKWPELAALYTYGNHQINNKMYIKVMQAVHAGYITCDTRLRRIKRLRDAQAQAEQNTTQVMDSDITTETHLAPLASLAPIAPIGSRGSRGLATIAVDVGSLSDIDGYRARGVRNLKDMEILVTKAIMSLKTKDKYSTKDLKSLTEVKVLQQGALKELMNKGTSEVIPSTKEGLIAEAIALLNTIKASVQNKAQQNKGLIKTTSHNDSYVYLPPPMGINCPPAPVLADPSTQISENLEGEVG